MGYLLLASDQGIGVYNITVPQKAGPTLVLFENYTSLGTSIKAEVTAPSQDQSLGTCGLDRGNW